MDAHASSASAWRSSCFSQPHTHTLHSFLLLFLCILYSHEWLITIDLSLMSIILSLTVVCIFVCMYVCTILLYFYILIYSASNGCKCLNKFSPVQFSSKVRHSQRKHWKLPLSTIPLSFDAPGQGNPDDYTGWAKKTGPYLNGDNFAMVNGR